MINTDNVDKYLLVRRIQLNRTDVLQNVRCFYVIAVLRHVKKGYNMRGIFFELRKIKHTTSYNLIISSLSLLIAAGYVRQNSRGSLYYITETGIQALKDFNNSIEAADYVNYNKKAPVSKIVKRPGL